MRSPGFTLCAALAVAVLSPGSALAFAARAPGVAGGAVAVTPSAVVPGTDTALQVSGCTGRTGSATSDAFVDVVPLARVAAGLVGDARVRSTADPGAYTVSVRCDGQDARAAGSFEVVPAPARATGDEAAEGGGDLAAAPLAAPESGTSAERPASPSAPVRAGGGGTAGHRAAPPVQESRAALVRTAAVRTAASHEGDGIYAVGLVLAGGAALALTGQVLRMRRRRKGSDDGDAG
ncbi:MULTISPECIES: hypothetical protein [Streptomyces]|uniref:Uncharacterized protein n=2 Tax=Streptomyces rimosus subsp. rimosus TaxID=132474 RepID=L8EK10_STRR1|nr:MULTISPECIES: hypothetical protein [Streptomyces]KOG72125.1 hypothetical protein ADK78_21965 [Kitasatospora aureofaciens]MYT43160.1 hypothetical protein [Streptomyces sp. SID5471]KEF03954.1 hypothetical protein DF17_26150 [Streptomyces rimosus]KEF17457.1 hypothetical protein DF18_29100 [Streptomyces rimosus]KOT36103.1 hypothetical protein ADK84_20840 [Streptomyces sp. NRRL WC-3701]